MKEFKLTSGIILRLAMLLGALGYFRTLAFSFVLDDFGIIVINPWLESWRFIPRFFTAHVWASLGNTGSSGYYRPLFLLWLSLNRHLFGLTPGWWHLTALALHLACAYLVYALAKHLLGDDFVASIAALLFAVFPAHIEAVAWVSGSSELVLAIAFLASFILYMDQFATPSQRLLLASLAAYGLALLAKETAIALALLIFVHGCLYGVRDGHPLPARIRRSFIRTFPYLLVTLAYFTLRVYVLHGSSPLQTAPLRNVLLTIPAAIWFYAQHLLWPFRLSYLYDFDLVTQPRLRDFFLPMAAIAVIAVALWRISRRNPAIRFLLCWIALLTAPAIAALLVFSRHDYVHDRYLYLPSVGFCILVAMLLVRAGDFASARLTNFPAIEIWAVAALALASVFTASTFLQAAHWDNDIALLTWASRRAPSNPLPRQLLAESYFAQGDYTLALDYYRQALALDPDSSLVNGRIAMAYFRLGQFAQAEVYLSRAIQLRHAKALPQDPDHFYYLSLAFLQLGNTDSAEAALRRAIQLQPHALGYHAALASLLTRKGDVIGAQAESRAELNSRAEYNAATQRLLQP